ncbi:MAG: hypothetical protein FJY29_13040 [Betaproteobacteria bacterium]|nr:hypothetical protein [Betaproteobacteria bacterium]
MKHRSGRLLTHLLGGGCGCFAPPNIVAPTVTIPGIKKGLSGLVVFIQRFDSAANLNIHFHVIALDGLSEKKSTGRLKFYAAQAATAFRRN